MIYTTSHGLRTWKGFYLKAVDGSSIYLFKDDAVEATFGYHKNQHQTFSMPMARIGLELDVLNGYCTQAQIQSCREAEGVFADVFLSNATSSDLHIYDRCFANFSLIFKHLHKKSHFLIRCSLGFNVVVQAFVKSGSKDAVVTFPCTKNAFNTLIQQGFELTPKASVSVRLVRLDIGSDEPEYLSPICSISNCIPTIVLKSFTTFDGVSKAGLTKSKTNSNWRFSQGTNHRQFTRISLQPLLFPISIIYSAKLAIKKSGRSTKKEKHT